MNIELRKKLYSNRVIDPITGCWLWTGKLDKDGYGLISVTRPNGKQGSYHVHRIAFEEFVGEVKNYILHIIECPNRHCFVLNHLYNGTAQDNANDVTILNRNFNKNRTHCKRGHEFTKENTIINSDNRRLCRICRLNSKRKAYYKNSIQYKLD